MSSKHPRFGLTNVLRHIKDCGGDTRGCIFINLLAQWGLVEGMQWMVEQSGEEGWGRSKTISHKLSFQPQFLTCPDPRKRDNEGRNWRKAFYCCHLKTNLDILVLRQPCLRAGRTKWDVQAREWKLFSMGPFVSSWERSAILELQGLWCIMENTGFNSTQKKDSREVSLRSRDKCLPIVAQVFTTQARRHRKHLKLNRSLVSAFPVQRNCSRGVWDNIEESWVFSGWKRER